MKEKKKNKTNWLKVHKKQLIISEISFSTLIIILLGIKNKGALIELCNTIQEEIKKGIKYSAKWFYHVINVELMEERERVRLAFYSAGTDSYKVTMLEMLKELIDKEISRRAWGNEIPHVSSIPREHGRYLRNDD